jgi:hypothetical protein
LTGFRQHLDYRWATLSLLVEDIFTLN